MPRALDLRLEGYVTLDQLAVGQRGRIEVVRAPEALLQRLLELGLVEGQEVEVVGFAPLGDPIEVRLDHGRLCLRQIEAAHISVSLPVTPTR